MRGVMLAVLAFLLCACVERRLFVRTDPPGATVRINGAPVGVSPATWRFDKYGTVLVEAELNGHEPEQAEFRLRKPWYQQPVVDFFADVLLPIRIRDDHEVTLVLQPLGRMTEEALRREVEDLSAAAKKARASAGE